MWRSLWRSFDRFSLQHFRHLADELQDIVFVNKANREFVKDILRSIVEVVIYGDQNDKSIFECFMEYQILAEFLRVLKISTNSSIEAPLLQYLSIMIQNLASDHAIYYCFSNEYINNIILHQYSFDGGDLAHYYVSFLRTLSGKLNRDTICLLVRVQEDVVVSFPLYTEALKFAHHEEKMIQIAVRALTLNIYNASDEMVYKFITRPPASEYFSEFVLNLKQKCFHLDALATGAKGCHASQMKKELLLETDKVVDDLYYCNDILRVGEPCLSTLIAENILSLLVIPILLPPLLPPLLLSHSLGAHVSAITSLFILSRLVQVVVAQDLLNFIGASLLYPQALLSVRSNSEDGSANGTHATDFLSGPTNERDNASPESKKGENTNKSNIFSNLSESVPSDTPSVVSPPEDTHIKRSWILSLIFSESHGLLLASMMLLIILSESKDVDYSLSSFRKFCEMKFGTNKMVVEQSSADLLSHAASGNIFASYMPQILTTLLEVLNRQQPFSVIAQWNTGWVLRKLLICPEKKLTDHHICTFKLSFKQSAERLIQELNGSWFDYIPLTLGNEWEKCKTALEESAHLKDPLFSLELFLQEHIPQGDLSSSNSWQMMVNAVKNFVLHHLLGACIFGSDFVENPLRLLRSTSKDIRGRNDEAEALATNFRTYMDLGTGAPCRIALSKTEQRDVFLIPVVEGISGKLFLTEKLPLHRHRGIVIAVAPLAGLSPKKDENYPTWLHLRIREFDEKIQTSKTNNYHGNDSDEILEGRWTLGFSNAKACDAALLLIMNETDKQRSSVKSLLAPWLQINFLKSVSDDRDPRCLLTVLSENQMSWPDFFLDAKRDSRKLPLPLLRRVTICLISATPLILTS